MDTTRMDTALEVTVEPTATVFVFKRMTGADDQEGLLLGAVWHARFGGWMVSGGHVDDEPPGQAAIREAWEEGGWRIRLLDGPSVKLPASFPHSAVPGPWMVVAMPASPDSHTSVPHVHHDHVFAAEWLEDVAPPETRVQWMTEAEVAESGDLPEDSRLQAKALFGPVRALLTAR